MGKRSSDLTGVKFGNFKVIRKSEKGGRYWICLCGCGVEKEIRSDHIMKNEIYSCGCMSEEIRSEKRIVDITGKRFGRLVVRERINSERKGVWWICDCDCGGTKILTSSLLGGNVNSCGCINLEKIRERNRTDISDKRFGMLVAKRVIGQDKNRQFIWECLCDCGNTTKSTTALLLAGNKSSCGCLKESMIAKKLKEYLNNNYNVVFEYKILKNPETKHFLPFDVYLPDYNIVIEIQGHQHYYFMKRFHVDQEGFEYKKKKDEMKKKFAKKNGMYIEIDLRKIKTVEQAISIVEYKMMERTDNRRE